MTLQKILEEVGVKHAHIVDDAYDEAPGVPSDAGVLQTFVDSLNQDQLVRLYELLQLDQGAGDVLVATLGDSETLAKVFAARGEFGSQADVLFSEFLAEREAKQKQLAPLVEFLTSNGVKCHQFGASYPVENSEVPQLVFIDLRLREQGPVQVDDAVEAYKKLQRTHKLCQPFVFLMSTQGNNLSERRDEFRERAELFASQFEAMGKAVFDDTQELGAVLAQYLRVLPRLHQLHAHIDGLGNALQAAALNVQKSVRALDLADYFVLHQNTASIEKVGLGTYISDLLLDYVVHEVEGAKAVWDFAKDLDEWKLEDLPRSRFALTTAAAKIYTGNLLHSEVRLEGELERGLGPVDGYFYLGDIFFSAKELNEAKPALALAIATPACDLVRPEELRKRTIFLCEGKVKTITAASVPAADDGIAAVVMAHPRDSSKRLLIKWNKKRLHTWHEKEMLDFAKPEECHWVRVGRLRPLYAIQLQHAITADLGRIGVQRAPNVLVPHGIEVLVRGDAQWQSVDSSDRTEATAGAMADSGDREKQTVFIVGDPVVRRIRRTLSAWVEKNPDAKAAPPLRQLLNLEDFDQRMMYLAHQLPAEPAEGESVIDITAYPFSANVELAKTVAFVRPGTPSRYLSVSGGQAPTEQHSAFVVVKFVKVT